MPAQRLNLHSVSHEYDHYSSKCRFFLLYELRDIEDGKRLLSYTNNFEKFFYELEYYLNEKQRKIPHFSYRSDTDDFLYDYELCLEFTNDEYNEKGDAFHSNYYSEFKKFISEYFL